MAGNEPSRTTKEERSFESRRAGGWADSPTAAGTVRCRGVLLVIVRLRLDEDKIEEPIMKENGREDVKRVRLSHDEIFPFFFFLLNIRTVRRLYYTDWLSVRVNLRLTTASLAWKIIFSVNNKWKWRARLIFFPYIPTTTKQQWHHIYTRAF